MSCTIGDHGMTLLTMRKGFEVEADPKSDCAPLNGLIEKVTSEIDVKWMRDPPRSMN